MLWSGRSAAGVARGPELSRDLDTIPSWPGPTAALQLHEKNGQLSRGKVWVLDPGTPWHCCVVGSSRFRLVCPEVSCVLGIFYSMVERREMAFHC